MRALARFVGGDALSQLWLFIVASLVGGIVAAVIMLFLYPRKTDSAAQPAG
ncbi:hypothetical protein [Nocardia jiangxiensis]|uniref:Uncharacterized protein n=1 Tax=Nocardia jiangxiensis TaxID=282685 RepID=A0ABW6RWY6_9NOCA